MSSLVKNEEALFASKLHTLLSENHPNLLVSPYSLSAVLTMVLLGAKEGTKCQLQNILGCSDIPDHILCKENLETLSQMKNITDVILETANMLYADKSFALHEDFIEQCSKYFGSNVTGLDFRCNWENSRIHINQWVQSTTRGKIENLLSAGTITSDTSLVLVNALYFKGKWKDSFEKHWTTKEPFYVSHENTVTVDMMKRVGKYNIKTYQSYQIIELPYKGEQVAMYITLPHEMFGLNVVQKQVSENLLDVTTNLTSQRVCLSIPKLKLEDQFDLVPTLEMLGLTDLFSEKCDLNGISAMPLFVTNVVQKTFIEINEEGTEAAAATALVMAPTSCLPSTPPVVFNCDHPFMFLLMHKPTHSILFSGTLFSP